MKTYNKSCSPTKFIFHEENNLRVQLRHLQCTAKMSPPSFVLGQMDGNVRWRIAYSIELSVLQLCQVFVLLFQLKTKQLVLTICFLFCLQDPTSHL